MSYISHLLAVRAHFLLSQAELAAWLGLSRALLASVETGREQLPRHARPWLRSWQAALAAAPPEEPAAPEPPLLPPPTTGPAAVLARLAECHYQAQRLGQQLARLHAGHRTARRRLAAGPLLLAALPPPLPRRARSPGPAPSLASPSARSRHRCLVARSAGRPGSCRAAGRPPPGLAARGRSAAGLPARRGGGGAGHWKIISSLTNQITPLEIRVASMPLGEARTKAETARAPLSATGKSSRMNSWAGRAAGGFPPQPQLDTAQRTPASNQDCQTRVQSCYDALLA